MKSERYVGPWDLAGLSQVPDMQWEEETEYSAYSLTRLSYANESYQGRDTRVFAYYAQPKQMEGPIPAIVLLHGGAGKAFPEWAGQWAERGYAAIAMDLFGNGSDGDRMSDGGPNQTNEELFFNISTETVTEMWPYHAVAAAIRAVSILDDRPEIDASQIGLMGISWGGYLAEIVAGLESRLSYAITVYAGGYFEQGSHWANEMKRMSKEQLGLWNDNFEISRYVHQSRIPMMWATGTNDTCFPLDNWHRTYRSVQGKATLRLIKDWQHGYHEPWGTMEFIAYADSNTGRGTQLAITRSFGVSDGVAWAEYETGSPIQFAKLLYTQDDGDWQTRRWQEVAADLNARANHASAALPDGTTIFCFILEDERELIVSTELVWV
ncbi:hypothetical protein Back11_49750 [Paenibacillus baekrokdamisoli]|uniref:Acetyl xylan esterase domain-containing protein n=1 Tax=Paenibacillus baekrokdamisoli TaxID=1712516 RepID=A0A3G9IXN4_9BACL|nr:alpha/beta fold hydrolase [Paenibacillus baekrokdamisoli]MBB3068804.1 dienelactone hydrolase [Paenibacillus baekrokdamisoli]BBH23630.1 hypothetical protein Back11_49750 [Paenibacillus baekrokdamisoli]